MFMGGSAAVKSDDVPFANGSSPQKQPEEFPPVGSNNSNWS